MNKAFHIIAVIIINILILQNDNSVMALEFAKEADKAQWIKEFFKNKEFEPIHYAANDTKEEKEFKRQLLKDFITQNGIKHIEPIAIGESINDPEIAKFNTACPDKKPINISREWQFNGTIKSYEVSDEMLSDPIYSEGIGQYKCDGSLKIFKFNVFNTKDKKQDFILYCNNFTKVLSNGKLLTHELLNKLGSYLQIYPAQCLYSRQMYIDIYSFREDSISGIIKYLDDYFFYNIGTFEEKVHINVYIWKEGVLPWSKLYHYNTRKVSR